MGGCCACSPPGNPTGRRWSPCSRACPPGVPVTRPRVAARARTAPSRVRARRPPAVRARPLRDPGGGAARAHARLADRRDDPQPRVGDEVRDLMGVEGEIDPAEAPHAPAPGPRGPRRRAEVRVRRRPQRARARERPRDGGAGGGRGAVLQGVPAASSASSVRLPRRADRLGEGARAPARSPARRTWTRSTRRRSAAPTPRPRRRWWPRSMRLRKARDTVGGVFEVLAYGAPPGLGSYVHYDRKLDARLAAGADEHPVGEGRGGRRRVRHRRAPGIEGPRRDRAPRRARSRARTARAGGIEGGMSTGEPIRVRAAMKPFSTVPKPLATVDLATKTEAVAIKQRTDVCAVPAGGVVGRGRRRLRARERRAGEVRGRLARRDPWEPRALPGDVAVIVYLVGMPGAGQVRRRARSSPGRLGVPFVDLDAEIEREQGAPRRRDLRRRRARRRSARWRRPRSRRRARTIPRWSPAAAAWSWSPRTGSRCGTRGSRSTSTCRSSSSASGCGRRPTAR